MASNRTASSSAVLQQQPEERNRMYNTNLFRRPNPILSTFLHKKSRDDLAVNPVRLVPIRLDLEIDGMKIRDSFTWNLNGWLPECVLVKANLFFDLETQISPEQFGQILVDDIYEQTPPNASSMITQIANAIRQQCQSWVAASHEDEDLVNPEEQNGADEDNEDQNTETVDDDLVWRTIIRLDLQVGETHLVDQFEWPLVPQLSDHPPVELTLPDAVKSTVANTKKLAEVPLVPTPESFAKQLCADLGMGGEFVSIIAHSIREQLYYARLNFDEAPKVQTLHLPPISDQDRTDFAPFTERLSEEDLEARFKEQERTARRMRRSQRLTTNTSTIVIDRGSHAPGLGSDSLSSENLRSGRRDLRSAAYARAAQLGYSNPYTATSYGNYHSFSALPQQYYGSYGQQRQSQPKVIPYRNYRPSDEEQQEVLKKLEDTIKLSKFGPAKSPPKVHRGFGASAQRFNADGSLQVGEFREKWRCSWCLLSGKFTPTLRKGPMGSKTLCNACGIWYGKHGSLPADRYQEHAGE